VKEGRRLWSEADTVAVDGGSGEKGKEAMVSGGECGGGLGRSGYGGRWW
jgi:hypothetical protein